MASFTHGTEVLFGEVPGVEVPPGWELVMTPRDWVVAIDPDGREWFVGGNHMTRWRVCPPEGLPGSRLKPGQHYMDFGERIPFRQNGIYQSP